MQAISALSVFLLVALSRGMDLEKSKEDFIDEKLIIAFDKHPGPDFNAPTSTTDTQNKTDEKIQICSQGQLSNDQSSKNAFVRHVKELAELPQTRLNLEKLELEIQDLRKENECLREENGEVTKNKMNIFKYVDELNEKDAIIKDLCEEVEKVKDEKIEYTNFLEQEITKLTEENAKIKLRITNVDVENAREDCLLRESNQERGRLSEALKNEKLKNFYLREKNKSQEITIGNLLGKNVHKNSKEITRLRERNIKLQAENEDNIKKSCENLRERNNNLREKNNNLQRINEEFANEKEAILKEKNAEFRKLREDYDQVLQGRAMIIKQITSFNEKHNNIKRENKNLLEKNIALRKTISDDHEVRENCKFKMDLAKEVEELRRKKKKMEKENKVMNKEVGQLRQKLTLQEDEKKDDAYVIKNGKKMKKHADFVRKQPEDKIEKIKLKKKGNYMVGEYVIKLTRWQKKVHLGFIAAIFIPAYIIYLVYMFELMST